jgi:hypothetical protein
MIFWCSNCCIRPCHSIIALLDSMPEESTTETVLTKLSSWICMVVFEYTPIPVTFQAFQAQVTIFCCHSDIRSQTLSLRSPDNPTLMTVGCISSILPRSSSLTQQCSNPFLRYSCCLLARASVYMSLAHRVHKIGLLSRRDGGMRKLLISGVISWNILNRLNFRQRGSHSVCVIYLAFFCPPPPIISDPYNEKKQFQNKSKCSTFSTKIQIVDNRSQNGGIHYISQVVPPHTPPSNHLLHLLPHHDSQPLCNIFGFFSAPPIISNAYDETKQIAEQEKRFHILHRDSNCREKESEWWPSLYFSGCSAVLHLPIIFCISCHITTVNPYVIYLAFFLPHPSSQMPTTRQSKSQNKRKGSTFSSEIQIVEKRSRNGGLHYISQVVPPSSTFQSSSASPATSRQSTQPREPDIMMMDMDVFQEHATPQLPKKSRKVFFLFFRSALC